MGNCVPSNIDPHSLVESPREIRRQSKTSYPTHDTCTTGDGDTSSMCSSSLLDIIIKTGTRLSKINSTSRVFIRPHSEESGKPILSKSNSDCELKSTSLITTAPINEMQSPSQTEGLQDLLANIDSLSHLAQKSSKILLTDMDTLSRPSKNDTVTLPKPIPKNNSFTAKAKLPSSIFRGASSLTGKSPEDSGLGSCSGCTSKEIRFCLRDHCKCDYEKLRSPFPRGDFNDLTGNTEIIKHTCDQMMYESVNIPPVPPKTFLYSAPEAQTRKCRHETAQVGSKSKSPGGAASSQFYEEWNPDISKLKFNPESPDISDGNRISPARAEWNYEEMTQSHIKGQPLVAVARKSFIKRGCHQLSVSQKERLIVLNQQPINQYHSELDWDIDDLEREWWLVEKIGFKSHSQSSRRLACGFVPAIYLEIQEHLPFDHEAWMDIDRQDADRLLLLMGNPPGTYILRPSSDSTNTFALSLRCFDQNTNIWLVKHYRVRYRNTEGLYHVFRRATFPTIDRLISHHSSHADGLACRLEKPYPKHYEPPSNLVQLEVNRSSFAFVKRLGRGSFGEVWQALWNKRVPVAIKKLLGNGNMEATRFLEEARLMQQLNHRRIVRLLAVCTKPLTEPAYIVTELMECGSLKTYMQHLVVEETEFLQMIEMMRDVSEGMAYLEQQHFIHRDLRASNVLVDGTHQVKVADFGLAHMLGDTDEYIGNMQTKFPIRWTAPEGMLKHAYTTKSDVWSFGVLVYEILTFCEIPYKNLSSREVKEQVCSGYRLPRPSLRIPAPTVIIQTDDYEIPKSSISDLYICPADLYAKILECWHFEPENRPDFHFLNSYFNESVELLKLANKCENVSTSMCDRNLDKCKSP